MSTIEDAIEEDSAVQTRSVQETKLSANWPNVNDAAFMVSLIPHEKDVNKRISVIAVIVKTIVNLYEVEVILPTQDAVVSPLQNLFKTMAEAEDRKISAQASFRRTVIIPVQIAKFLYSFVHHWKLPPLTLGSVRKFIWNNTEFSDLVTNIEIDNGDLLLTIDNPSAELFDSVVGHKKSEYAGKSLSGETENVEKIGIDQVFMRKMASDSTGRYTILDGKYWNISIRQDAALWVCQLMGKISIGYGNLTIATAETFSTGHLALEGAYSYYLICKRDTSENSEWYLVINTKSAQPPDREILGTDFQILQFVLGVQLRADVIYGITCNGEVAALMDGRQGAEAPAARSEKPVPIDSIENWQSVLFRLVSAACRSNPKIPYYIPLTFYTEALADRYLDIRYLKLQVAIEAFCLSLLQATETSTEIVTDKKAWKNWVKENQARIESFAKPGFSGSLYNKVISVYRLASGRVVPNALERLNLKLTADLEEELEGRDPVVHTAVMSPPNARDGERDLRRVAMVRTILVAIIAKSVNYTGAITGWTVDEGRRLQRADSDWWTIDESATEAAKIRYLASTEENPIYW
jgi:hypothetical protein